MYIYIFIYYVDRGGMMYDHHIIDILQWTTFISQGSSSPRSAEWHLQWIQASRVGAPRCRHRPPATGYNGEPMDPQTLVQRGMKLGWHIKPD